MLAVAAGPVLAQAPEPRPLVVRELSFEGNRAIDDLTLSVSIATTNSSLLARWWLTGWIGIGEKKRFNEIEFQRDVYRLILLYRQSGYPHVHVDTIVRRSPDAVRIRFVISEGPPVVVHAIDIAGADAIIPERDLLHDIPLAVGDPFNRFRFDAAADTIRTALRNRGYPYAEVFRSYDVREDSLVARLAFEVEPGPRAVVDTIVVEGTDEIADNVVRRMIPLRPGDRFRQSALYESQRDLYRLGIFNYVNVGLADSLPAGPDDSTVAVRVQVSEGALNRVRLGAGYGTVDCFRALLTGTAHGALGGGRAIDVTARASKIGTGEPFALGLERGFPCEALEPDSATGRLRLNYNVTLSLREPFLFSRRTRGALSIFAERHSEVLAFVREVVGGNLSITQQTPWDVPVTVSYHLSYGSTSAEAATFCSFLLVCNVEDTTLFTRPRYQSMVSAGFVRDRANSVVDPTRGNTLSVEARYASPAIGSDELIEFAKSTAEFASYHPVGRRTTFAWRIRGGAIVSPRVFFLGQSVKYVPPSERFYAGGPNSVRGFPQNLLGPVVRVVRVDTISGQTDSLRADTLTAPSGGNRVLIANAELRFPLPILSGRFGAAVFVDAGQVFGGERDFIVNVSDLRVTPGLGLRLATPLGPMRFDVAYNPYGPQVGPLYRQEGTQLIEIASRHPADPVAPESVFKRLRFHFAVGQPF